MADVGRGLLCVGAVALNLILGLEVGPCRFIFRGKPVRKGFSWHEKRITAVFVGADQDGASFGYLQTRIERANFASLIDLNLDSLCHGFRSRCYIGDDISEVQAVSDRLPNKMTLANKFGILAVALIVFDAAIAFAIKRSSWDDAFTFTFWPALLIFVFAGIKGSRWWFAIPVGIFVYVYWLLSQGH